MDPGGGVDPFDEARILEFAARESNRQHDQKEMEEGEDPKREPVPQGVRDLVEDNAELLVARHRRHVERSWCKVDHANDRAALVLANTGNEP